MRTRSIFLAFAALVLLSSVVGAQSVYDNALSFANVSVSPNPVVAGGNAVISFQLYNTFGLWLYDTSLQPSGSYPLLNASPMSSLIIGQVNQGLDPTYYNYTFAVPSTTPSGTYTLTFTATYFLYGSTSTSIASSAMPVSFYVQNKPVIKVTASSSQPAALYSGYNQTVSLNIENAGYGTARNVSVTVSAQPGLSLLSSVNTFFISNLTQGSSVTKSVLVSARGVNSTGLVADVAYSLPDFSQSFNGTELVNLSVAPAAQFGIGSQGSGIAPGATDVPVRFKITNTGTSEAQQMRISLETTYPITPVASTAYVSSLPAGASANVTFLVSADSQGVPGNYPVTLYEQWKQPNGAVSQQFSGSSNYFISVQRQGAAGAVSYAVAVAVIAVACAVVYVKRGALRKRLKRKK